jgi:hypothetical protein
VSAETFAAVFNTIRYEYGIEPIDIVSDRANSFKCVYTRTLESQKLFLEKEFPRITWNFNASRAPWWGGFYERMMSVIKDKLARCFITSMSIYKNIYRFSEAVAYTQNIINSRPLTWMSEDIFENQHAICPGIFLNFYTRYNFHESNPWEYGPPAIDYQSASKKDLRNAVKIKANAYNALWNMFYDHYIMELRQMSKETNNPTSHLLREGMVVIFRPIGQKRSNKAGEKRKWRLARIVKLHPGRDKQVRAVDLLIYSKEKDKTKILPNQSIQNIAMLEADVTDSEVELPEESIK